ncbi:MAG: SUMF1/EgtB/PvdO family nonheme iron enzyme [Chloroflexi bacterium]|nr:SUMF1/EgtB/PvdO family nonheme iron enzyme [Chloroflexota bacterium]
MVKSYYFENIRILLIKGFSDEELRHLCFDVSNFEPVYDQLAQDTGKDKIVSLLLEYAKRKLLIDQLLAWAKAYNPTRYETHQPYYDLVISPIRPFEPEMLLIPAGPFLMGNPQDPESGGEWQQHEVDLSAYKIGKYPITNEQYAPFVAQNPERRPQKAGWRFTNPPPDKLNQPVVGVSWDDALAYCEWLQEPGRLYRLPTEAEWEKAFRNAQGFHVASGVREWTSTLWGEDWKKAHFTYPYQNDKRENLKAASTFYRIYRGGAAAEDAAWSDRSIRGCHAPTAYDKNLSFRVASGIDFEG